MIYRIEVYDDKGIASLTETDSPLRNFTRTKWFKQLITVKNLRAISITVLEAFTR